MDYFIERLIKRRFEGKTVGAAIGIICAAVVLFALSLFLWPVTQFFCFVIWSVIIAGAYMGISNLMVEYEYILTNHELDVDKIIAKKRRVRLASLDVRTFDKVAKGTGENETGLDKDLFYASSKNSPQLYYIMYTDDGARVKMVIDANDAMLKVFKIYLQGKVCE